MRTDLVETRKDPRYIALRAGLGQLDDEALLRLARHVEGEAPLVLDTVHYDHDTGSWCAFAVALDVPAKVEQDGIVTAALTEEAVVDLVVRAGIEKLGSFSINPMSGVEGDFYRHHRYRDLALLARELVVERGLSSTADASSSSSS